MLLCTKPNRVSCLRSVATLARVAPRILSIQLQSGWADFWPELRKVGKAVGKQGSVQAAYAVLAALRIKLGTGTAGTAWHPYLSSGTVEEAEVVQRHFLPLARDS